MSQNQMGKPEKSWPHGNLDSAMLYSHRYGCNQNLSSFRHAALPVACRAGRKRSTCTAMIRARWCLDARYCHKQEATELLKEWVRDIGTFAGLSAANTRINTGAIGAPESRLELEVSLEGGLAEWEQFLSRIAGEKHVLWAQRIKHAVVDGSPRWEVYRNVPLGLDGDTELGNSAAIIRASNSSSHSPTIGATGHAPSGTGRQRSGSIHAANASSASSMDDKQFANLVQQSVSSAQVPPLSKTQDTSHDVEDSSSKSLIMVDSAEGAEVILDWKGDPLVWNPGDSLGGKKFL